MKAAADSSGWIKEGGCDTCTSGTYGESKIAAENYILSKLRVENGDLRVAMQRNKLVYILRTLYDSWPG